MISKAKLSYLRISPRKVRLVADLIRGEKVERAQAVLKYTRKKAVLPIVKLLNQAVANAKDKTKSEDKEFYISQIYVDEGPVLKRVFPRSRGKSDVIQKRTSHITLVLDEVKGGKKKTVPASVKTDKKEAMKKDEKPPVKKKAPRKRVGTKTAKKKSRKTTKEIKKKK
jgi:large subunit ribosomal protein L22